MQNNNTSNIKVIYIDNSENFDKLIIQKVSMISQYNFTQKELPILKLLVEGKTNKQIAQILYLSESTIKTHVSSICQKLYVRNRIQAVRKITELGLV